MSHLRYNPLLDNWTLVNSARQNRPHMPKGWCPFCPGSGKVPDDYKVHIYDNDFPVLSGSPEKVENEDDDLYLRKESYGKCEVILYSPEHETTLCNLGVDHIAELVELINKRVKTLKSDKKIQYVMPFENKGEEVGVTMPHPHGQIYAYNHVPLKLRTELDNAKKYYQKKDSCMFCKILDLESKYQHRIIFEDENIMAVIPYFTDYPYGVFILPKLHRSCITDFNSDEKRSLAVALKVVTGAFDQLFKRPFPYMMIWHGAPSNSEEYKSSEEYYHFNIQFYPPLRDRDKIKYYASSEMGAWAAANVLEVETTAPILRSAKLGFIEKQQPDLFRQELEKEFVLHFYTSNGLRVFRAPARVNLIGEHIDYNGGKVLPAAIDQYVYFVLRPREDSKFHLINLDFPGSLEYDANDAISPYDGGDWRNYFLAVLDQIKKNGDVNKGIEGFFFSQVSAGSGISSSAAFELVSAFALSELNSLNLSGVDLAKLCQKAENEFIGVKCGIMDQFACSMGKAGKAISLDCDNLDFNYIDCDFGKHSLVVINTNKKRKLEDSKYNERLDECKRALAEINQSDDFSFADLCSVSESDLERVISSVSDERLRKRTRHVISENLRVIKAIAFLENKDAVRFGALLNESHESLSSNYEVTGPELDYLYKISREFDSCLGCRMTGAGFGGSFIALIDNSDFDKFKKHIIKNYKYEFGVSPEVFLARASDGVKELI